MPLLRRSALLAYFLLAFGVCWLFWVPRALLSHNPQAPETLLITLQILGALGPAAAALLVTGLTGGRGAVRNLCAPYRKWRVGAGWYALVIIFRPLIWLAALGLNLLFGWQRLALQPVDWVFFAAYLLSQPLVVGVGEELGWMGFAYPRLRARFPFLPSSLLLGAVWALWHLPMFFTLGDSQYGSALLLFVLKLTALRLVMALAFESTGSLLMPALFHVSLNVLSELVPLSPNDPLATALLIAVTVGLICAFRFAPGRFQRQRLAGGVERAEG